MLVDTIREIKYVDAAEIVNLAAVAVIEARVVLSLIKHGERRCILPGMGIIMIAYAISGNDLSQMTSESRLHVCGRRVINAASMAIIFAFVCVG